MIRCMMVKFAYVFKNYWKVKEFVPKCQLMKNAYWYIGSALMDSYNDHVCVVFGSNKWIACFVPKKVPNNLLRKQRSQ